jgi:hypothetical protein
LACPAVGLAVVAVDLHSLHLLYSLMKDRLSQHEYVAVPFGRWEERRFYGLVLAWQWHTTRRRRRRHCSVRPLTMSADSPVDHVR